MKKVLSVLLSALMIISLFTAIPISAGAAATDTNSTSATSGDFEYDILDDGTAEITYYSGSATELIIPGTIDGHTVTSIGYEAFYDCTSLASITIPNSVTSIGSDAFYNTAWYNNQPNGIVYAGKVAYAYKGEMPENTSIVLEDGTLGIAERAFYRCSKLANVTIPNSVTSIDGYAFAGCTSLTSVIMGNGVTSIDRYAFGGCESLASATIPDSVTSIGEKAFGYYSNLDDEDNHDYHKIDSFTIYGYPGTAAETYADENGFEFISLGEAPATNPTTATDASESTASTNPTEPTANTDPTESSGGSAATDPTQGSSATDPTESTAVTDPTESTQPTTNAPSKTTVTLADASAKIYVKGTAQIKATVKNGEGNTTYTSSNKKVAKVSANGKVTGLKKGTAKITVTNNGVSKIFKVTVKNPKLSASKKALKKGGSFKLKITGKVGKAKFKSSNKKVAAVNSKGRIVAKRKGKATITVTTNGMKLKCRITVV